jgi:hypothetical protein
MTECPRERALLDWLLGRDPVEPLDPELQRHVDSCRACADLVTVARVLHEDGDAARREARVPSAGVVWWRASIRARAEAARRAEQPISLAATLAAAALAGAAGAVAIAAWQALPAWPQAPTLELLAVSAAAVCIVAPLAVVFALVAKDGEQR